MKLTATQLHRFYNQFKTIKYMQERKVCEFRQGILNKSILLKQ